MHMFLSASRALKHGKIPQCTKTIQNNRFGGVGQVGNESLGDLSLHCILDVRATAVLFFLHVLHEICVCITK